MDPCRDTEVGPPPIPHRDGAGLIPRTHGTAIRLQVGKREAPLNGTDAIPSYLVLPLSRGAGR